MCENILTVTGGSRAVNSFTAAAEPLSDVATSPLYPQWPLPTTARNPLSFQRMLPTTEDDLHKEQRWGCPADAESVSLEQGRPRLKGRTSVRYTFETRESPPIKWVCAAAALYPSLDLGYKFSLPEAQEAYELVFLRGRLEYKTRVSVASWLWAHRADRHDFFLRLKMLLNFPDGKSPKKKKLKAADVEARLLDTGELAPILEMLNSSISGWAGKSRLRKLWRSSVLPEFVVWLHAAEREPAFLA